MGINPWQILKLDKDISWQEIEQKLSAEGNVDSTKYKSIFESIAGTDGILSKEEWDNFSQRCDKNKDGNLVYNELMSAYKNFKNEIIKFYNMLKDIVSSSTETSALKTESQEQYIETPLPNKYRAKSRTKGNFTDKWLEQDKYGSKTYKEWIDNLAKDGYEFDTEIADKILSRRNRIKKEYGKCSKAVTDTISGIKTPQLILNEETGEEYKDVSLFIGNRQECAYQNASEYANNPNFREIPHNIVATMDLTTLPKGCIIVYDANYIISPKASDDRIKYHMDGHIGITDGTGYDVASEKYPISQGQKDTKIRIFIPVKPKTIS